LKPKDFWKYIHIYFSLNWTCNEFCVMNFEAILLFFQNIKENKKIHQKITFIVICKSFMYEQQGWGLLKRYKTWGTCGVPLLII